MTSNQRQPHQPLPAPLIGVIDAAGLIQSVLHAQYSVRLGRLKIKKPTLEGFDDAVCTISVRTVAPWSSGLKEMVYGLTWTEPPPSTGTA